MVDHMEQAVDIQPQEIRAIRIQLGLSQIEAGRLIGGGPSAFTKYEAGTVKPAASVTRLLRVLQVNPATLATLRGNRTPSVAGGMGSPFDVTGQEVTSLTERKMPQLLRRLLHAEAKTHGLPSDGIHVASNISAPDDGEDGRITWQGGPDRTPFLPSRVCQFQLKSGKVTPSAAAKDVLTKGHVVKLMICSVLEAGGNYTMLCTLPYTQQQIDQRRASIRQALRSAGVTIDDRQVDFWDAEQIAAWVNQHPAVALWVREQTPTGTLGPFRSWSHWRERPEHEHSPWVEDERLNAFRAHLHDRVEKPRSFVRIVGPAGVGKSRLVLEALRSAREGGESDHFLADVVLYAVQSESRVGDVYAVVQKLADSGGRAVVVVDQCEPETHRILAGMVSRPSSRLSLVTIDDETPAGTLDENVIKVDEAPLSVTEAIINHLSPGLSSPDRDRLVRFSKGFPKTAILIAEAWSKLIPLAHVADNALVEAFVLGRRPRDRELLLRSATLLAVFGRVEAESLDGQLSEIANLGRDIRPESLYAAIGVLVERGAARRRGRFVALQPRPIALSLAEQQWKEWDPARWDQVLTGDTSPDLRLLAARQLALLNTTPIAERVVAHVCRPGGPFGDCKALSKSDHTEVLSALAEVNPEVVADQIERSLKCVQDLRDVTDNVRRHLVWALEKVSFHSHTFEQGARLLLRLAAAENETWGNNATGQFKGLFPMILGGTAADGNSRLRFLDEAATTDDPRERVLVVEALVAGSRTSNFFRTGGSESQGSRPALESWRPTTGQEAIDYINACVTRLGEFATNDDEAGLAARKGLGHSLRFLVLAGMVDTVEGVVAQVSVEVPYWPDAIASLRQVLAYNTERLDADVVSRVRRLVADLQPRDLKLRVRALVTEMSWDYFADEESGYEKRLQRQTAAVRQLATELLEHPATLSKALPDLSRGAQRMAGELGVAVAEFSDSPLDWLEPIIQAAAQAPEGERSFDLLTGFIAGLARKDRNAVEELKRRLALSPILAPALPQACFPLGISSSDIELAIGALQAGLLPPWRLSKWAFGGVLAEVPAPEVAPLFDAMLDDSPEGFVVAIDLMGMYAFGDPEKLAGLRPQVLKIAKNLTAWQRSSLGAALYLHEFEQIVKWMLSKGRQGLLCKSHRPSSGKSNG